MIARVVLRRSDGLYATYIQGILSWVEDPNSAKKFPSRYAAKQFAQLKGLLASPADLPEKTPQKELAG